MQVLGHTLPTSWGRSAKTAGRVVVRSLATATARWRVAPDVVIIGTKRGGTTSLFRDLERHPAMLPLVPSAARLPLRENMKGVHYFDSDLDRSLAWYRGHFVTRRTADRRLAAVGDSFTAEASPYYLFHPLAAERAARMLPADTLYVALLRDPVERTVSHWSEQTRNGVETLTLRDALAAEDQRVGDDGERLRRGEIAASHAHEQQSYAAQSHYAGSLRRWFDQVGRHNVLVLFSEDYYAAPDTTIGAITDRIGVDPIASDVGEHRNAAPRASVLDDDLEAALVERFRDDVADLTTLLGVTPPWPRFDGRVKTTPAVSRDDR